MNALVSLCVDNLVYAFAAVIVVAVVVEREGCCLCASPFVCPSRNLKNPGYLVAYGISGVLVKKNIY